MGEDLPERSSKDDSALAAIVGKKASLKMAAQLNPAPGVYFGLGMIGLIGWSVVIPTLLGAALGLWLDKHYPGKHVWTLALLVVGLAVGCLNAWHWIAKEDEAMREVHKNRDE